MVCWMIYPNKLSSKKIDKIINILVSISIVIGILLVFINKKTNPNFSWSSIANIGIIYIWITVIHSINRSNNIASYVLLQMVILSAAMLYIDKTLTFNGWSIYIGIPIVIILANIIMLVLAIVRDKYFINYIIYQLVIVFISLVQLIFILTKSIELKILNEISIWISLLNLIISLYLSYKDYYRILKCKFHM